MTLSLDSFKPYNHLQAGGVVPKTDGWSIKLGCKGQENGGMFLGVRKVGAKSEREMPGRGTFDSMEGHHTNIVIIPSQSYEIKESKVYQNYEDRTRIRKHLPCMSTTVGIMPDYNIYPPSTWYQQTCTVA